MARRKDSQKQLLEHSDAKVKLLGTYLEKYLNIISNNGYTKNIQLFDLFCGEGRYDNLGEGSALTILKKVNELHKINPAKLDTFPKIDVLFNDKNIKKTDKLRKIIENEKLYNSNYGKVRYRNLVYKELVQKLSDYLRNRKNTKAFIFIDPYGYKDIDADDIELLMSNQNSEVLLFSPVQFMYRFAKKGTPSALKKVIDQIIPELDIKEIGSAKILIEVMKSGFKNYLENKYFVDTFTIEKDINTVYCLFFFSNHIRGFEKMLEAKWELDEQNGKGWSYEKTFSLFPSADTTNEWETRLVEFIGQSQPTNGELYEFTLRNGYLPRHTGEVLKSLQNGKYDKHKLLVVSNKNVKLQKGWFYINYSNYNKEPNKVYFKF